MHKQILGILKSELQDAGGVFTIINIPAMNHHRILNIFLFGVKLEHTFCES